MLKPELIEMLEVLFAIGGNHDRLKSIAIKNRLLDFLKREELLLDGQNDGNINLANDAIRFIDASNVYAITTSRIEAGVHMQPFFERLIHLDNWNYYVINFLVSSLVFTENVEQALELSAKATQNIIKFRNVNNTDILEGYLASNVCSRILYAEFFDSDVKIDLAQEFRNWFSKLKRLVEKNNMLELISLVTQIKRALFYQVPEEIAKLCLEVDANYNEKIADMVKGEVSFYLASEKYKSKFFKGGEKQ